MTAEAHLARGLELLRVGRFEEVVSSYDQAIALGPDCVEAHFNRGAALEQLKRFDEAVSSYNRALALLLRRSRREF